MNNATFNSPEVSYDVPPEWTRRAYLDEAGYRAKYEASIANPEASGARGQAHPLVQALHPGEEHELRTRPGLDPLVRGRHHERRLNCIDRHLRRAATRWRSSGRATTRRIEAYHLSRVARRGLPHGEHHAHPRRREGRPGHDLSADDPRGRLCDACLRAARRHPFGGLRRLLAGLARGPHRGREIGLRRHRRRGPARRPQGAAQGERRRGDRAGRRRRPCRRGAPHGGARQHGAGPRRLLRRGGRAGHARCPCEEMDAEDPLFILYTSGSTGKPKGVLHTTGGYLVWAAITHQYVFDYHDGDIYWCTADVGWVTGHSYILYGPLANGATTLMFEGVPTYPRSPASGRSSTSTTSTSSTPRRPPSAPSCRRATRR